MDKRECIETKLGLLVYAENLVLPVENKKMLVEQTHELLEATKRVGLEINMKKNRVYTRMIAHKTILPEEANCHLK